MVDIADIPDFENQAGQRLPGQRPSNSEPSTIEPIPVVLVSCPLDRGYKNIALNSAAVDAYIAAEIAGGRAYVTTVERWSPWSTLQVDLGFAAATRYNYARMTVGGQSWYGFLDAEYLNLTGTAYQVTQDAWTTYGPTIGYSTVVRGHVAVAASAGGDIGYCLEPEPFTPGDLIGYQSYTPDPLGTPRVLVISTTDLRADPFVLVDDDIADTMVNPITQTLATGQIMAPQPGIDVDQPFPYAIGNGSYTDLYYYPYVDDEPVSTNLVVGDEPPVVASPQYRPFATGATPSLVDGVIAEGGAFVYPSIQAAITHLSKLAHAPWISDGIQRVLLIPGGSSGSYDAVDLSPRPTIPEFSGDPTYFSEITTEIGTESTLAATWYSALPSEYDVWTKLRTGPFSAVQIGDRLGSVSEFDPQEVVGMGSLRVRFEGVFYPEADVAAWIIGAGGTTDDVTPTRIPLGADMSHYAVGRDSVLAGQAAGISAERSQSVYDMLLALQRAITDTAYTRSSAFTSSQFAIAEAI